MPVTNIEYITAARTDYAGTPDEKFIAQAIHKTQRYYDVSELEKAVPTDAELSGCSLYYIGDEIDYYMGTGELIEENILDNVEGTLKYLTTGYIYDTKNNIKTTIDSTGKPNQGIL